MLLTFVATLIHRPGRKTDRSTSLGQRLECWSCGLYETEHGICKQCPKCNDWTVGNFDKIHWRDRMIARALENTECADKY